MRRMAQRTQAGSAAVRCPLAALVVADPLRGEPPDDRVGRRHERGLVGDLSVDAGPGAQRCPGFRLQPRGRRGGPVIQVLLAVPERVDGPGAGDDLVRSSRRGKSAIQPPASTWMPASGVEVLFQLRGVSGQPAKGGVGSRACAGRGSGTRRADGRGFVDHVGDRRPPCPGCRTLPRGRAPGRGRARDSRRPAGPACTGSTAGTTACSVASAGRSQWPRRDHPSAGRPSSGRPRS